MSRTSSEEETVPLSASTSVALRLLCWPASQRQGLECTQGRHLKAE